MNEVYISTKPDLTKTVVMSYIASVEFEWSLFLNELRRQLS